MSKYLAIAWGAWPMCRVREGASRLAPIIAQSLDWLFSSNSGRGVGRGKALVWKTCGDPPLLSAMVLCECASGGKPGCARLDSPFSKAPGRGMASAVFVAHR